METPAWDPRLSENKEKQEPPVERLIPPHIWVCIYGGFYFVGAARNPQGAGAGHWAYKGPIGAPYESHMGPIWGPYEAAYGPHMGPIRAPYGPWGSWDDKKRSS